MEKKPIQSKAPTVNINDKRENTDFGQSLVQTGQNSRPVTQHTRTRSAANTASIGFPNSRPGTSGLNPNYGNKQNQTECNLIFVFKFI